jgi:hypothetical protein
MNGPARQALASSLLLFVCAAAAYGQYPERSAVDEHYAPITLRGVKDVRVAANVQVFMPEGRVTPGLEIPEVRARVEALLKRADIGHVSDEEARRRPDSPVLRLGVVATGMEGGRSTGDPGEHRLDGLRLHQGASGRPWQVRAEGRRVLRRRPRP